MKRWKFVFFVNEEESGEFLLGRFFNVKVLKRWKFIFFVNEEESGEFFLGSFFYVKVLYIEEEFFCFCVYNMNLYMVFVIY